MVFFRFECGFAATDSWNKRRPQVADCSSQKKYTANGLVRRGCPKPFWPVRCRPSGGAGRLPKRTAVAGRPVVRFHHNPFMYDGRFLRATNDEPRATIFSRAEGHSRRCSQFEFVAAKRRLSPRRPATGGAVGSKIKKFKFFCFFRRNLHPRVEYYTYKGRDHKE